MNADINKLKEIAKELRKDVLKMVYNAKDGHPGSAFSIADIVAALYFHFMNINSKKPDWNERDRFILSKGHSCTVVYAALARLGFFPMDDLLKLRAICSPLQGHPCMKKTVGIDMTTGSLGHGLSIGTGMAMAGKLHNLDYKVYVILGDGELNEGIVWESAISSVHLKANNLIAFIDKNGYQSGGLTKDVSGINDITPIWKSFGWFTQEIDGHDFTQIINAVETAQKENERPSIIIANTVKGKGVPFMENDNSWHKRVPTKEQLDEALKILDGSIK
jgi:transketolase